MRRSSAITRRIIAMNSKTAVFERILQDAVAEGLAVGLSARITRNGEDLYRGSAGFADKENNIPFTCDTMVHVFSMTKLVTGVAALKLLEEGCFWLDDPVCKYLPCFRDMKVIDYDASGQLITRPAAVPITIRHLFNMTAGFSYHIPNTAAERPRNLEDARILTDKVLRAAAVSPGLTSQKMLEYISTIPLAFEPGSQWLYGVCSDVLAGVVESIAQKPWGEFLKDEIFKPLGMKDTCFRPTPAQERRLAVIYDYADPRSVVPYDPYAFNIYHKADSTNEHFIGGLLSTLDDFSIFGQMLANRGTYNGVRILGENTVRLMASDQLTPWQYDFYRRTVCPAGHSSWGMMCRVTKSLNNVRPYLFPGSFGWSGWAGTHCIADPERNMSFTFMVNRIPQDSYGTLSKLTAAAYAMI